MKCLDSEEIRALLESRGLPDEQMLAHLETCDRCQHKMDLLSGLTTWSGFDLQTLEEVPAGLIEELSSTSPHSVDIHEVDWKEVLDPSDHREHLGQIGPYAIIRVVARGGMGTVFLARDERLDREVAIKMMHPSIANTPKARTQFEKESRAVAALDHPNILAIHDVGEIRGRPYLVMPYVPHGTMQDRLDGGEIFGARECRVFGAQVAEALAHAHDQGIVHRDLKPSNILFDPENERVLLADFGLSESLGHTNPDNLVGTPEFMSPEQARGEPQNAASDLYSLGSVLHAMRKGSSPYRDSTTQLSLDAKEAVEWIAAGQQPEKVESGDGSFSALLRDLQNPEPDQRPSDARDVARRLRVGLEPASTSRWTHALYLLGMVGLVLAGLLFWRSQMHVADFLQVGEETYNSWQDATTAVVSRQVDGNPDSAIRLIRDHVVTEPLLIDYPLRLFGDVQPRPLLDIRTTGQWLTVHSGGELEFEGLEVRFWESKAQSFIVLSNASVKVHDCRFANTLQRPEKLAGFEMFAAEGSASLAITDTEMPADKMTFLNVRDTTPTDVALSVSLQNSDLVFTRIVNVQSKAWTSFDIDISTCCFLLSHNLISYTSGESPSTIPMHVEESLIVRKRQMIWAPKNAEQQKRIQWKGRGNTFAGGGTFLNTRFTRLGDWAGYAEEVDSRMLPVLVLVGMMSYPDPLTFDFRESIDIPGLESLDFPKWERVLR